MIKAGVLDDVEYAVGAHIRPIQDVPAGKICAAVRHTASATTFVTIKGRGAHAARPHLGVNTIDVACRVIGAVQDIWLNLTEVWSAKLPRRSTRTPVRPTPCPTPARSPSTCAPGRTRS